MLSSDKFLKTCREVIVNYYNEHVDVTDNKTVTYDDTFIVWYNKSLQNHKALLSTNVSDGMYYEITYDGDRNRMYFDAYKKWEHKCIELDDNYNVVND